GSNPLARMKKHTQAGMKSSSQRSPNPSSPTAIFPAANNGTLPSIQAKVGPHVGGNQRDCSSPVGGFDLDGGMAAGLHPLLGLGQPCAPVRRCRDSRMRWLVVGKFL